PHRRQPNDPSDALAASSINLGGDLGINAQNGGVLVSASFAAAVQTTADELGDAQPAAGSKSLSWAPVLASALPQGLGAASNGLNLAGQGAKILSSDAGLEADGQDSGLGVSGDASLNEVVHDTADAFVNEKLAAATATDPTPANIT